MIVLNSNASEGTLDICLNGDELERLVAGRHLLFEVAGLRCALAKRSSAEGRPPDLDHRLVMDDAILNGLRVGATATVFFDGFPFSVRLETQGDAPSQLGPLPISPAVSYQHVAAPGRPTLAGDPTSSEPRMPTRERLGLAGFGLLLLGVAYLLRPWPYSSAGIGVFAAVALWLAARGR